MRVWIDTDVGTDVDDALTLGYVLRHPALELVGVSTVFGDVDLRVRIAEALLAKAGGGVRVPVLPGLGVPLSPGRPGRMFGHEGVGILESPEPRRKTVDDPHGEERVAAVADAIRDARPDLLVAIGPLTNLGALVAAGASLPPLAIMGGKLRDVMLEGMIPEIAEWNWFCDPLAVRRVLAARHETIPRVVPAEVTFRTELAEGDVERLAEGDALARALAALSTEWLRVQRDLLGAKRPRVALHDPLTAAVLAVPSLCPFESRRVRVDDAGASHPEVGPANLEAAVDVDLGALRAHLMETWLGRQG